jgi:hypothetical protein
MRREQRARKYENGRPGTVNIYFMIQFIGMEKFPKNTGSKSLEKFDEDIDVVRGIIANTENEDELRKKLDESGIWYGQINWIEPGDDEYEENKQALEDSADNGSIGIISTNIYRSKTGAIVYIEIDENSHF